MRDRKASVMAVDDGGRWMVIDDIGTLNIDD